MRLVVGDFVGPIKLAKMQKRGGGVVSLPRGTSRPTNSSSVRWPSQLDGHFALTCFAQSTKRSLSDRPATKPVLQVPVRLQRHLAALTGQHREGPRPLGARRPLASSIRPQSSWRRRMSSVPRCLPRLARLALAPAPGRDRLFRHHPPGEHLQQERVRLSFTSEAKCVPLTLLYASFAASRSTARA